MIFLFDSFISVLRKQTLFICDVSFLLSIYLSDKFRFSDHLEGNVTLAFS